MASSYAIVFNVVLDTLRARNYYGRELFPVLIARRVQQAHFRGGLGVDVDGNVFLR
jgi:hypothetical protein